MNEKSKLYRKRVLLVLSIIAGILMTWPLVSRIYNPMRMPAPIIRFHILRHTPIGMCVEEAIEVIGSNGQWGDPVINRSSGFFHPAGIVPGGWPVSEVTGVSIIGDQSVQACYRYNIPLFLDRIVRIFWGFDENGELIDVYVESLFTP